MKTTLIILSALVLFAISQMEVNAVPLEAPSDAIYLEDCKIVSDTTKTATGADPLLSETILISDDKPRENGTIYAITYTKTEKKGPAVKAHANLVMARTTSSGTWEGDINGDGNIYYFIDAINNGPSINHYEKLPLVIKAQGYVKVTQKDLGKAIASAWIEIKRVNEYGDSTSILEDGNFISVEPTAGCKSYSHDNCTGKSATVPISVNTTIEVLLEPGKPIPGISVNLYAGARAQSTTSWRMISAYPIEYQYWGGLATSEALLDPLIYIDPTWEYADQFELVLSPGVEQGLDFNPPNSTQTFMPWIPLLLLED
jgi:hypothetical protein